MKAFKVVLVVLIGIVLAVPLAVASQKGSGYGSYEEYEASEQQDSSSVAVSGKIFFSDYYSMGGKKCAAFIEAEDGTLYCVLDNLTTSGLKNELGGVSGAVKVTGDLTDAGRGRYLDVDDYNVIEPSPAKKGSGYEEKGSGYEDKGSGTERKYQRRHRWRKGS